LDDLLYRHLSYKTIFRFRIVYKLNTSMAMTIMHPQNRTAK
jgi:hypothetical protein